MALVRPAALLAILAISACSTPEGPVPSLAPRAAETIDPRVPLAGDGAQQPVSPALAARLAELIALARQGDRAFTAAAEEAQRLTAAAGATQSESWVIAQQAVTAAVAARGPTTHALGDIDALAARELVRRGGIAPADLAAIEAAAGEVGAMDRRHSQTIDALQARLAG